MENPNPTTDPTDLKHLSYMELSKATRNVREFIEEGLEEDEIVRMLQESGHNNSVSISIFKRARLEIQNEKIKKSLTTIIVMILLSVLAGIILPLTADDTVSGGGMARRVYFWIAGIPVVTVIFILRHLALVNERKYMK